MKPTSASSSRVGFRTGQASSKICCIRHKQGRGNQCIVWRWWERGSRSVEEVLRLIKSEFCSVTAHTGTKRVSSQHPLSASTHVNIEPKKKETHRMVYPAVQPHRIDVATHLFPVKNLEFSSECQVHQYWEHIRLHTLVCLEYPSFSDIFLQMEIQMITCNT